PPPPSSGRVGRGHRSEHGHGRRPDRRSRDDRSAAALQRRRSARRRGAEDPAVAVSRRLSVGSRGRPLPARGRLRRWPALRAKALKGALFLAAFAGLPLVGAGPILSRRWSWLPFGAAVASAAAVGAVILGAEMFALTVVGVRWTLGLLLGAPAV